MRAALKHTLRLHDHLGSVTKRYFELCSPFLGEIRDEYDAQVYRAYIQEIVTDRAHYSDLTADQKYLHDLGGLISPVLSAYPLRLRLSRLKPRTGDIRASSRLEECCQQLAIYAYNFRERVKSFGDSVTEVIVNDNLLASTRNRIGKVIKCYDHTNKRILRYRNFVIHGPKGRLDEFADLRSWQLGAILLHDDIWLDYNNAFEEARSDWISIARAVIVSMESAIAVIQLLNENLIALRAFRFLQTPSPAEAVQHE